MIWLSTTALVISIIAAALSWAMRAHGRDLNVKGTWEFWDDWDKEGHFNRVGSAPGTGKALTACSILREQFDKNPPRPGKLHQRLCDEYGNNVSEVIG
jgi:hypothetical protein